jgi:hypothetical protein
MTTQGWVVVLCAFALVIGAKVTIRVGCFEVIMRKPRRRRRR